MKTARHQAFGQRAALLASLLSVVVGPSAVLAAPDQELQLGAQVYEELKAKGEIVATSPLYDVLKPIADRITKAAQPRYEHPFHFYLVHEKQPNAFATPGGNVYVTDSLMFFVKNTEQLAGTLCHEVSHTIHHDSVELMEKRRKILLGELTAGVLLGPSISQAAIIALVGKLNSLHYSREAESRADVTGSDICAGANYNPWGLVWLFRDFKNANLGDVPELLSDHPSDTDRVQTLESHFKSNPAVFGGFSPDPKTATPVTLPKDTGETFVR